MAAPGTLNEAIAEARKVVGDKASIPKPKIDIDDALDQMVVKFHKLQSALSDLYTQVELIDRAFKSYRYGLEQNAAIYKKADFGLDENSKDDAKKIKQVHKIFDDFFVQNQKAIDDNAKGFSEFYDRVLAAMGTKWTLPP